MRGVMLAVESAWRVLVLGGLLGVGVPVLLALGVRAMSFGAGGEAVLGEDGVTTRPARPVVTMLGWGCFAIVLAGVALGVAAVVATGTGRTVSFQHGYPTIVASH